MIRPDYLNTARASFKQWLESSRDARPEADNATTQQNAKEAEKKAIAYVIGEQQKRGVLPLTSGEFERPIFYAGFFEALDGVDMQFADWTMFRTGLPTNRRLIEMGLPAGREVGVAKDKSVYRDLEAVDLNHPLKKEDGHYDVVICVGTLTKGHVGAQVLDEFCRVTSQGGLIVATVHDEIWKSHGYEAKVEALSADGRVETVSADEFGIIEGASEGGRMIVLRRQ